MTGHRQKMCVCQRPHTHTHDWKLMPGGADKFTRAVLLRTHGWDSWKLKFQGTECISVWEWAEARTSVSGSVRPGDFGPNTNKQAEPPAEAQTVPLSLEESEPPELIHEDRGV